MLASPSRPVLERWWVRHQCDMCHFIDTDTVEITEAWTQPYPRCKMWFEGMFTCYVCESDRQPVNEILDAHPLLKKTQIALTATPPNKRWVFTDDTPDPIPFKTRKTKTDSEKESMA